MNDQAAQPARKRSLIPLTMGGVGLILLGVTLWLLLSQSSLRGLQDTQELSAVPVEVSFDAPTLTLKDLGGRDVTLSAYTGQVVLVNLWATWCPPCKAEMPIYQRFFEQHEDEGFTVIAINDGESAPEVTAFVREHGLTFPVWLDPTYLATEHAFKTPNLPTSYVLDRSGRVRLMWIGAISEEQLTKHVIPIIKE